MTFYSCTTSACSTKTSLGTGTLAARARPPWPPRACRWAPPTSRRSTGPRATTAARPRTWWPRWSTRLGTTSVLTSSPNPSTYGSSVTFTDTVSASSGTPGGTVTFYSCTTSACRHQDLAWDRDARSSGKATLATSTPAGGHHLRRGRSTGPRGTTAARPPTWWPRWSTRSGPPRSSPRRPTPRATAPRSPSPTPSRLLRARPAGTVTFYSCTTNDLLDQDLARDRDPRSSGKATSPPRACRWAPPTSRRSTAATGNYGGSTSNVVAQVVNALGPPRSSPRRPTPRPTAPRSPSLTRCSASSGTPSGTVTFYSCTTSACSTKTSLGTGTLDLGQGHLDSTSSLPVGTTYVEAIYAARATTAARPRTW